MNNTPADIKIDNVELCRCTLERKSKYLVRRKSTRATTILRYLYWFLVSQTFILMFAAPMFTTWLLIFTVPMGIWSAAGAKARTKYYSIENIFEVM